MRVLFTMQPALAHLHLFAPVARALQRGGDEVRVATAASFCPAVEELGLTALPAGVDWNNADFATVWPDLADVRDLPAGVDSLRLCAERTAAPLLDDLTADGWQADVVVRDYSEFGGALFAERLGVPTVVLRLGARLLPTDVVVRVAGEALDGVRAGAGLPPDPTGGWLEGDLRLDFVPRSFRRTDQRERAHQLRPEVLDGDLAGPSPDWLDGLPDPLVYCTMGTVFPDAALFRNVVRAVDGLDVGLLLSTGDSVDREALGPLPDNVRATRFVPSSQLGARPALAIVHGGYTTVMSLLVRGIPLVIVPQASDHFTNAKKCRAAGVARVIEPHAATRDRLRQEIVAALGDDTQGQAAQALQAELAAQPGPSEGAELIRQLVRRGPHVGPC